MKKIYKVSIFAVIILIAAVILYELVIKKNAGYKSEEISAANKTFTEINGNIPYFTEEELTTEPFENYSELDSLDRCGAAYANICKELMPDTERGEIGMIKPSGWHTVKYDIITDGRYLYNRCHLIAYSLAGENANPKNLITGNHVLYRVTPDFKGDNLVASGVLMEAYSVEDDGKGICFCVYIYNIQPGIEIDYRTGESHEI